MVIGTGPSPARGLVRRGLLRLGDGDLARRGGEGGFVGYITLSRRGRREVEVEEAG